MVGQDREAGSNGAMTSSSISTKSTRAATSRRGKSRNSSAPRSGRPSDLCAEGYYFNRNQIAPAQKQSRNRTNASLDVCMRWTTINTDLIGETGAEDSTHSHRVMRSTYVLPTTSVY